MLTITADDVLPVHMADALTGEAPFWDEARGSLWWIDIQGQRLLGFEPASGRMSSHRLPLMPGFVVSFAHHGLVLGLEDGIYPFAPETGVGERLFAVEEDLPANRLNDGKTDAAGRLWFGSMDKTGSGAPVGALYSGPDGTDDLRTLITGAGEWLIDDGVLVCELSPEQAPAMVDLAPVIKAHTTKTTPCA